MQNIRSIEKEGNEWIEDLETVLAMKADEGNCVRLSEGGST